jgi:hypothetical protein
MMRNEHIVRAHQTPVAAKNPETGTAWRVIHVDNETSGVGAGTAESPYASLASAQTAAVNEYDIVYVHQGASATSPYVTPISGYSFGAANQYFIGEGSSLTIPTSNCGATAFFGGNGNGAYPILTNPLGPAIAVNQPGSVVSHFQVVGARVGISDGTGFATGLANVSDVIIAGSGPGQRGVEINNSTGTIAFDRLQLSNLTNDGFVLSADGGSTSVSNSTFTAIEGRAFVVTGDNARGVVTTSRFEGTEGTAVEAAGVNSRVVLASSTVANTIGTAVRASGVGSAVQVTDTVIRSTGTTAMDSALVASGVGAVIGAQRVTISRTDGDAVIASGQGSVITFASSRITAAGDNGVLVSGSGAQVYVTGTSQIRNSVSDGVRAVANSQRVLVQDSQISNSLNNGISVSGTDTQVTILRSDIRQSGNIGVYANSVTGTNGVVQIYSSTIATAALAGVASDGSNVDIGRTPGIATSAGSSITSTGIFGVTADLDSDIRVANTTISAVDTGIDATNLGAGTTTNLTALNNNISVSGSGAGITISANALPQSLVQAQVLGNRITTSGSAGITLTTVNAPAYTAPPTPAEVVRIADAATAVQLGVRNVGTTVVENPTWDPAATDPREYSQVGWDWFYPVLPPTPLPLASP